MKGLTRSRAFELPAREGGARSSHQVMPAGIRAGARRGRTSCVRRDVSTNQACLLSTSDWMAERMTAERLSGVTLASATFLESNGFADTIS